MQVEIRLTLAGFQRNKQETSAIARRFASFGRQRQAPGAIYAGATKNDGGGGTSYEKVVVPIIRHDGGWCDSAVCV